MIVIIGLLISFFCVLIRVIFGEYCGDIVWGGVCLCLRCQGFFGVLCVREIK